MFSCPLVRDQFEAQDSPLSHENRCVHFSSSFVLPSRDPSLTNTRFPSPYQLISRTDISHSVLRCYNAAHDLVHEHSTFLDCSTDVAPSQFRKQGQTKFRPPSSMFPIRLNPSTTRRRIETVGSCRPSSVVDPQYTLLGSRLRKFDRASCWLLGARFA